MALGSWYYKVPFFSIFVVLSECINDSKDSGDVLRICNSIKGGRVGRFLS